MNNFEKFLQIIGNITFSVFIIYIAHEAIHYTMQEKLISTEVSKQINGKQLRANMEFVFKDIYNASIEEFHTHINENEMQIIFGVIHKITLKNGLEPLTQDELDEITKIVIANEEKAKAKRKASEEKLKEAEKEAKAVFREALKEEN